MVNTKVKSPEIPVFTTIEFSNREELKKQLENNGIEETKKEQDLIEEIMHGLEKDRTYTIRFTKLEWKKLIEYEQLSTQNEIQQWRREFWNQKRAELRAEYVAQKRSLFERARDMLHLTKNKVEQGKDIVKNTKDKIADAKEKYENTKEVVQTVKKGGILSLLTLGGAGGLFGWRKAKEKLTQEFKIHTKLKLTQWTLKVFGWMPFLGSFLRKKEGELKDELKALKEKYEKKDEEEEKKADKEEQKTQEKEKENVSEKKEQKEDTPENLMQHPALKILGASAGTIVGFAGIRKALEKMDTIPGVSTTVTPLLKAGNFLGIKGQLLRPLATLGIAGLVLTATIKIQQHLEKHPELLTKRDPDASWWKNILDSVHSLTDAEKGYTLPILTGEKNIDEYDLDLAEANAHPEGYVPLSFHVENATSEVQEQVYHIQDFIKEHPAFSGLMGVLFLKKMGISGIALGSMSAMNLSLKLAKAATWGMPFVALFGVLAYLQGRRVLHASVPKDPEEFKQYLISNKKNILGFCQEHELALAETKVGEIDDAYLMTAGHLIAAPGAITEVMHSFTGKVMNVTGKLAEKIGNTPLELANKRNIDGLEMMITKLKRKKDLNLEPLMEKIKDLRTKTLNIDIDTCDVTQNPITSSEIQALKKEAEKHNIAIDIFHGYVTWSFFTEIDGDRVYDEINRLCIDPSIESPQKREDLATQFQIDTDISVPGLAFDYGEAITNDALIYLNAIGNAIQEGNDAEATSMFEYLQQTRGVRLIMVGTDFFLEGAKQKMIDLPKDLGLLLLGIVNKEHGINAQEFVLRMGNGLIPMIVFSTLREHFLNPLNFTKENRSLIKRLGFTPKHIIKEGTIAPLKTLNTYSRATGNILKDIVTRKPTKTISHIVRTEGLRYLHLHMDIMSKMPGTKLGDRYLDIAETIRTKFRIQQLQSNLSEFTRSGISARELGKEIEELLSRSNIEKLQVGGKEMTKAQIVQAVRSKKKNILQDLIDGLDTKITRRNEFIQRVYLKTLKNNKLTGGITRITERALARAGLKTDKIEAMKKAIGKNPKIASGLTKLMSNGIPPAMAAIMIYDLHTSENKREIALEHTTFLAAFWGGQKATSTITKNPIITIMGGLATALGVQIGADFPNIIASKLEAYGGEKFSRACDSHLTKIATRLEILTGIQGLKNMIPSEPIEKILLATGLPKGVEILSKHMLRPVAIKLARKINAELIKTSLRMAGKKLGAVTAGTVASSWVPGLNIAMLAWTGYEVVQLGRMMHKAHKTNKLFEAQGQKEIESMHFDARTENVLSDAYVKDFPGEDFRSLSEDEQTSYASNILADEDRFGALAYCNMTIKRADQTSEVMEFEQGEPVYIEIRTKEETIKLSEDDLGEAENWEAPTTFTPKNITKEKYAQLDADESFAKLFYTTEALALRNTTKWTQLMVNPTDTRNIEIMRTGKQGEKIMMTRGSDDTWKLTSKQGELASGLDLYQALALANLNLYIDDFIESKVYGESDKKWLPENETKQPFRFKKDKIIYAKDNARDVAIVGNDDNWMDFYTKNLKLTPTTIVTSLNTHFQL